MFQTNTPKPVQVAHKALEDSDKTQLFATTNNFENPALTLKEKQRVAKLAKRVMR